MSSSLPTSPEPAPGPPSPASTVKRKAGRARYDAEAVYAVLDAGWVAHVGLVRDGEPVVIPMVYARDGDRLLLHGSVASQLMRGLDSELPVSVAVTHVDGVVLARSAFHHAANYRSVVVRGVARRVSDPDAVASGFARLVDHVTPGRSVEVRLPDATETRQTLLVEVSLDDAAVKFRTGGPNDDERDLSWPVWAGVVPLSLLAGEPVAADELPTDDLAPPEVVTLP